MLARKSGRIICPTLRFQPFIPTTSSCVDLSPLEELIKGTAAYRKESVSAACVVVRGSTVSSYDGTFRQAHPDSDIDLIAVSDRPSRTNQYRERLILLGGLHTVPLDVRNANITTLNREIEACGSLGVRTLFDLTHDAHPLEGLDVYRQFRNGALKAFLRIGLSGCYAADSLTPSGAMLAINQGKLLVNRLRWWSIKYAFADSKNADQNIARYYDDVAVMLRAEFVKTGVVGGEDTYKIPDGFIDSREDLLWLRLHFFLGKFVERLSSSPILSLNDVQKLHKKLHTLLAGLRSGKTDMHAMFEDPTFELEAGVKRLT